MKLCLKHAFLLLLISFALHAVPGYAQPPGAGYTVTDEGMDRFDRESKRQRYLRWHHQLVDRFNNLLNKIAFINEVGKETKHTEIPKTTYENMKAARKILASSSLIGRVNAANQSKESLDEADEELVKADSKLGNAERSWFKKVQKEPIEAAQTGQCIARVKDAEPLSIEEVDDKVTPILKCLNKQKVSFGDGMILTYQGLVPLDKKPPPPIAVKINSTPQGLTQAKKQQPDPVAQAINEAVDEKLKDKRVTDEQKEVIEKLRKDEKFKAELKEQLAKSTSVGDKNTANKIRERIKKDLDSAVAKADVKKPKDTKKVAASDKPQAAQQAAKTQKDPKDNNEELEFTLELDESTLRTIQVASAKEDKKESQEFKDKPADKISEAKKAAAALEEKKKLLEQAKKNLENKAAVAQAKPTEAPRKPFARKTQGDSDEQKKLNESFRRAVDNGAKDVADHRYSLSKDMADMGKLLALSEVEDLVASAAEKDKERERASREWDEMIKQYKDFYRSTQGLSFEERFSKLMMKVNEDHTRRYVSREENPSAIFMSQCMAPGEFCNCVGNTKMSAAVAMAVLSGDLAKEMPSNKEILIQDLGYHLAAVVYDTKDKTAWDMLAGGAPTADLKGNFYHPAELMNAELKRKGAGSIDAAKLLVFSGRLKMSDEENKQLAKNGEKKKKTPQFDDGLPGNVSLKDPSGGENKKTEHQYSMAYRKVGTKGDTSLVGGSQGMDFPEYQEPDIHYDAAISDMKALLSSGEFKDYLKLKRDPTLLANGNYDKAKIAQFQKLQDNIYTVLDGKKYVKGSNQADGYPVLRERLGKEFPELTTLHRALQEDREPLAKQVVMPGGGAVGAEIAKKYFDFFKALGPKQWALYKDLEAPRANEHLLSEALQKTGKDTLWPTSPPGNLEIYFLSDERVGYVAQYQQTLEKQDEPGGKKSDASGTNQKHSSNRVDDKTVMKERAVARSEHQGSPATVDEGKGKVIADQGSGNDPKGTKFKPPKDTLLKRDPVEFAEFISQEQGPPVMARRWTPGLTAALRSKKGYTKDLVEWFDNQGYRAVANARSPDTLVISGPDKKPIPKDVAVLLVDFIQNKDATGADKAQLTAQIEKNYGSVEKYLAQVKADFDGKPQVKTLAKKTGGNLDSFDVFKTLASGQGIDPKILNKAEKKSFSYKERGPETFMMGSPAGEKDRWPNEVQRQVTISKAYHLQATPVTQLQWYLVMGKNPSSFTTADADGDHEEIKPGVAINLNHPVESVSWDDVQEYIKRLDAVDGKCKYRLPTEAEWEAAARAKTTTAYSFGDDAGGEDGTALRDYAWFNKNSDNRTHAVAQKKPNGDNLYDMNGNVWQWTDDVYAENPLVPPTPSPTGSYRVIRGGGWYYDARALRSAQRSYAGPGLRDGGLGFRLVRTCP